MLLALGVSARNTQAGPITMSSFAASAPNIFASPSSNAYVFNALQGIDQNGATTGTAGQPTRYQSGTAFLPGDFIVTSFPSWQGEANPAAPFDNEFGNRVHFGLRVEGDGTHNFSLSMLNNDMNSNDPLNILDNDGGFSVYGAHRVGINYGADGIRQTGTNLVAAGDDTVIASGSASQLIDLLLYVGVGNALEATDLASLQDSLDYINGNAPFVVSNRYWLSDGTNTLAETYATATAVPEPATLTLLGIGAAVAVLRRRRS
jgi:hypothetical protein